MLRPYRDDALIAYRVSTEVNSNRSAGAHLTKPLTDEPRQPTLL